MKKVFVLLMVVTTGLLFACNDTTQQPAAGDVKSADSPVVNKQERNKAIAMESIEGINAHNVDQVLKNAAPDVINYNDGSFPPTKGIDSGRIELQGWLTAFPDVRGDNLVYVADGDWVMVWGDWSGTFKSDFMGMKATGKSYKMKDVDVFKFNEEGKITEHHFVQSPNTMMAQVGAKMPK